MQFNKLKSDKLIASFLTLVRKEAKVTANIVDYIQEIDARRLYLHFGCTSLFQYLTEKVGYSVGSAQRRIDAARILHELPEVRECLHDGSLNLTQFSQMARAVREAERTKNVERSQKLEVMNAIKGCDTKTTEQILCMKLEIAPKAHEIVRVQADTSVRLETTLSKEQMALVERVKELVSHSHPNPTFAELLEVMARHFLKAKDPLEQELVTSTVEVKSENPRYISPALRRQVFQQDQGCQWRDPCTGKLCGSKYQLQIDHRVGVSEGGGPNRENLQALCGVHNRLKHRLHYWKP